MEAAFCLGFSYNLLNTCYVLGTLESALHTLICKIIL